MLAAAVRHHCLVTEAHLLLLPWLLGHRIAVAARCLQVLVPSL
jgi:hypothetical protein